jgi:hypothetical protein
VDGELFGASSGLGFVIRNSGVPLAVLSIVLHDLVVVVERVSVPWVEGTTG